MRPYDRVSILLDLDRNYNTYYHLQIDERGCVCDDCWGDLTWDPKWYVAVKSEERGWQAEAAIPLAELTGDQVAPGHVWACNVSRILPGRGVQAMSLPADVLPRPEGMGLLLFVGQPGATPVKGTTDAPMTKARESVVAGVKTREWCPNSVLIAACHCLTAAVLTYTAHNSGTGGGRAVPQPVNWAINTLSGHYRRE